MIYCPRSLDAVQNRQQIANKLRPFPNTGDFQAVVIGLGRYLLLTGEIPVHDIILSLCSERSTNTDKTTSSQLGEMANTVNISVHASH
ncbi:MAG: hypothetical protein F4X92_04980 [Gammaproteobacteria bacterium]|nr:hypothetical protein [Gammaproteobacteria bacterium]